MEVVPNSPNGEILNANHTETLLKTTTIGEGRGCNKFVPVLGGNGTKIAPTEDIFDEYSGQMR